jgi:naphthoate synthase
MSTAPTFDVASMSAARNPSRTLPSAERDGFHLISRTPIHYDVNLSEHFQDITYQKSTTEMCARIAFNRPHVLNAFRPMTVKEVMRALEDATDDPKVAVVLLDAETTQDRTPAFCAGGDQTVRSDHGGYQDESEVTPRLRVLDLQIQMRRCAKPIMAVVRGYAIGGGHILHMVADLTLASENAVFGQTGPRMGSFDAGYGCSTAAALIGQKKARELWFLSKFYSAQEALEMRLVNAVFPDVELDGRVAQWVRRMVMNSPTALAATKAACNAAQDGAAGLSQLGGELTRLFYLSAESQEGRQAFFEKRAPQFRSKL